MIRSVLRPALLLLMLSSGIMCQPEKVDPPTLTGKIVIDRPCSHFVIQVLLGSIDPTRLSAMWKNPANDSNYINVFSVANRCTFPVSFKEGDLITFQLDDDPPAQLCDVCQIAYPVPAIANSVKNVQQQK